MTRYFRILPLPTNPENNLIVIAPRDLVQQIVITGIVYDAAEAMPRGVNVTVGGTLTGSVTDMNGKYAIEVRSPDAVLNIFIYWIYIC